MTENTDSEYLGRSGHLYSYAQIVFHLAFRYILLDSFTEKDQPEGLSFPRNLSWRFEKEYELKGVKIQSIISTALFLEAYIYDYVARRGSEDLAMRIDKADPPSKFLLASEILWEKPLKSSEQPYGKIKRLFSIRNKLVHAKSKKGGSIFETPETSAEILPTHNAELVLEVLKTFISADEDDQVTGLLLRQITAWLNVAKSDLNFYPIPSNA